MKLLAYDVKKLGEHVYKPTSNMILIEEFINSGIVCAKVEGFTHKNATSCTNSLNQSIRRGKTLNVKAIQRKNEVFLIRLDRIKDVN